MVDWNSISLVILGGLVAGTTSIVTTLLTHDQNLNRDRLLYERNLDRDRLQYERNLKDKKRDRLEERYALLIRTGNAVCDAVTAFANSAFWNLNLISAEDRQHLFGSIVEYESTLAQVTLEDEVEQILELAKSIRLSARMTYFDLTRFPDNFDLANRSTLLSSLEEHKHDVVRTLPLLEDAIRRQLIDLQAAS